MWGSLAHWIVDTLPALALVTVRVKIIDFKTVIGLGRTPTKHSVCLAPKFGEKTLSETPHNDGMGQSLRFVLIWLFFGGCRTDARGQDNQSHQRGNGRNNGADYQGILHAGDEGVVSHIDNILG